MRRWNLFSWTSKCFPRETNSQAGLVRPAALLLGLAIMLLASPWAGAQVLYGSLQVDGIPVNNSRGDEAQARRAEALVFESAVSNFSLTMKEHCAPQRVARLALVETGMAALAQRRIG